MTLPEAYMNETALQGDALKELRIRVTSLGVFRRGDCIFVQETYDPIKHGTFYRPLGGGIELGSDKDGPLYPDRLMEVLRTNE